MPGAYSLSCARLPSQYLVYVSNEEYRSARPFPYVSALLLLFSLVPSLRCWFRRYGVRVLPSWYGFAPNTPFSGNNPTHTHASRSLLPRPQ